MTARISIGAVDVSSEYRAFTNYDAEVLNLAPVANLQYAHDCIPIETGLRCTSPSAILPHPISNPFHRSLVPATPARVGCAGEKSASYLSTWPGQESGVGSRITIEKSLFWGKQGCLSDFCATGRSSLPSHGASFLVYIAR